MKSLLGYDTTRVVTCQEKSDKPEKFLPQSMNQYKEPREISTIFDSELLNILVVVYVIK